MGKAARRRKAPPRFDLDDFEPIRLDSSSDNEDEGIEQIHAFSIDDTDYYVPTAVPFHHSVKAMEIFTQRGEPAAVAYTLRIVLGDEGYEALMAYEGLKEEEFEAIVKLANQIVNAGSGKAQSSKRSAGSGGSRTASKT